MNIRIINICLVLAVTMIFLGVGQSWSAYPVLIQYRQTMTKVIQEVNVTGWPAGLENAERYFSEIVVSANGAKVGFVVKLNFLPDKHIFVMDADGSNLVDLTPNLPPGMPNSEIASLQINDSGSRLFFRRNNVNPPYNNIYYFDTTFPYHYQPAFLGYDWMARFTINSAGTTLYFPNTWLASGINQSGLVEANVVGGSAFTIKFNVNEIPHETNWGLAYLGSAKTLGRMLFTFFPDWYDPGHVAMYMVGGVGPLTKVPNEEHQYVWAFDYPNSIISADGNAALYLVQDGSGPQYLYLAGLVSQLKSLIIQSAGNFSFPTLSPDGLMARISTFGYNSTRFIISPRDTRDTFSKYFGESFAIGASPLTDFTQDNRYYFMGSDPGTARIHRIDMNPVAFNPQPNISNITFSKNLWMYDDATPLTVTAQVSDAKGLGNILWVKMTSLVDGREFPEWLDYEPLAYDPLLYDDGTHGDVTPGDGIFTNNTITLKKISNFYTHYTLPHRVGIRLVVKNNDDHYMIADTIISVFGRGPWSTPAIMPLLLLD